MGVYYNICRITGLLIKTELVTSKIQELETENINVETEDLRYARQDFYSDVPSGYTIFYIKRDMKELSSVKEREGLMTYSNYLTEDGNLSSFVLIEDRIDDEDDFEEVLDEMDPNLASIVRYHAEHVQCIFTYYS